MKPFVSLLALLIPTLVHAHDLLFDQGRVRARMDFTRGPKGDPKFDTTARLTLEERAGARRVDLRVPPRLSFRMEHGMSHPHGPGGPVLVTPGPAANVFDVREIYFTMPGPWVVDVELTYLDPVAGERREVARATVDVR